MTRRRPDGRDQVCGAFELVAPGVQVQGTEPDDEVPDAGGDVLSQALAHPGRPCRPAHHRPRVT